MTDQGDFIAVEIGEAQRELLALLKVVEEKGRIVRILRNGTAVAELRASPVADPLAQHPEISQVRAAHDAFAPVELTGIIFHADPTAPLDNEDWPESSR